MGPSRPSSGRALLGPYRSGAVWTAAHVEALVEALVVAGAVALSADILDGTDVFVALELGQTGFGKELFGGRHAHPIVTGVFGPIPVVVVAIAIAIAISAASILNTAALAASSFALASGV